MAKRVIFSEVLKNMFKSYITVRCGLYFKDHDLKNMEDAIVTRMNFYGFDSPDIYYTYLTTSEKKEDEFRELLNLLTVNHTYFFRDELQFKALRDKVLPDIIKEKRKQKGEKPRIRVWSAGCSTGEEPYSIAMVINDITKMYDFDIEIYATDVNTNALESAKKGVYGKNSMRLVNREHMKAYFTEESEGHNKKYIIHDTIRKMVNFCYLNLIDENFSTDFDIVFCRNVVIYFELETTIKIMDKLYSSLTDEGWLFIGYSENLHFMSDKFKMKDFEDTIFYQKIKKEDIPGFEIPRTSKEEVKDIIEQISRAELTAERKLWEKMEAVPPKKMENLLMEIMKYLHLKQYDEAKQQLQIVLNLNPLFAPAYYLFGSIYMEEEDLEDAKKSLRKALYLDKKFPLVHFALANVYKNEGRGSDALKEYRNTLKTLTHSLPPDIIPYSGGFNAGTLASICKNNIEILKAEEI